MKFKDGLRMAGRDLTRRKGRTFWTSLAIAVGTMLVVTLVSLGTSGEKMAMGKVEDSTSLKLINVMNEKYFDPENTDMSSFNQDDMYKKIDDTTVKKVKKIPGIENVTTSIIINVDNIKIDGKENKNVNQVMGSYNNDNSFSESTIKSVRKNNKNDKLVPIIAGRNLKSSDKDGVVVGQKFLKAMGITDYKAVVGKEIDITESKTENQNITVAPLTVKGKVIGVISDKFEADNQIMASIELTNKIKSYYTFQDDYLKSNGYESIVIIAKNTENTLSIGKSIKNMGYYYVSYQDIVKRSQNSYKIMEAILAVLGLIVLFVAAIGIVNTMTMVIYERTKSIGIMKSMGANRGEIRSIFILQAGIMGVLGGVIGLIFSFINVKIVQLGLNAYLRSRNIKESLDIVMPYWLVIGTLAFSIFIAVLAGMYPSGKASRMDPVDALNS
ncbi:putative ABC transport system permease protein [Clostridium acetobutylicum]|uniref:Predicted permease n=1 Tax=Clostridium acetobutylicum (strain ATCC 824 / DSM 792 / JCM 1419 / IAM 19013 / LMG 5710 / NBRC 13948 / NRRL B-527 / VKM B-1787 / 2291 / W) TaxID=272562 RepID=Q97D96_CLOAB|nr:MULTISPECIES: FtsX-like permease family protein [Clostridium]AAK81507.1 Predicted permease [Clostridium acetobutylicum ATCC 824]ADZ22628.1 permease [Clostridium acetobutylicum EA 2018]AEI32942.1 permease [Clostridium acetobutylicum DSM 1731]AWV80819.1 ABC transporter permease [Clostridium acetobutylicum]MBC2393855.1 ABC transporter permease [Clostridium acetobutylicum]